MDTNNDNNECELNERLIIVPVLTFEMNELTRVALNNNITARHQN